MPIYEYKCTACGHTQEEYLSILNIPDKINCEKCGKESKKQFSGTTNIIFKGDDWADKKGRKK